MRTKDGPSRWPEKRKGRRDGGHRPRSRWTTIQNERLQSAMIIMNGHTPQSLSARISSGQRNLLGPAATSATATPRELSRGPVGLEQRGAGRLQQKENEKSKIENRKIEKSKNRKTPQVNAAPSRQCRRHYCTVRTVRTAGKGDNRLVVSKKQYWPLADLLIGSPDGRPIGCPCRALGSARRKWTSTAQHSTAKRAATEAQCNRPELLRDMMY